MPTSVRIAGPLDPFKSVTDRYPAGTFLGAWRINEGPYLLNGVNSIGMAQSAVDKGLITRPGTYALTIPVPSDPTKTEVALVTIKEKPPVPVKPRLTVVNI